MTSAGALRRRDGLEFVGPSHPRRIANHRPRSAARAAAHGRDAREANCETTGSPSITWTSAAVSGCRTTEPRCRQQRTTRQRCFPSFGTPAFRSSWNPDAPSSRRPARSFRAWSTSRISQDGKAFVIVDAGMTELMRPMLYGAYHRIEPVACGCRRRAGRRHRRAALREQRHARQGSPPASARSPATCLRSRRRSLRRGDGVQLQPAHDARRGARRWRHSGRSFDDVRPSTTSWRSRVERRRQ